MTTVAPMLEDQFGPFGERAWLNTAHQGPLPRLAADRARASIEEKLDPRRIPEESFFEIPKRLRRQLARLIGADPDDVVLGNSTSYGLDLLAHGLDLHEGDEVLLAEGDFPATIYPWLPLERRGVRLRTLPAPAGAPEPDDLRQALSERTKVVCMSWVFSFTGRTVDVPALVGICRDHGDLTFVLNGSQAVGARPTDIHELGVDALVSCGFKWLCGPYATGFAWLSSKLRESLEYQQGYWLAQVDDISRPPDQYELRTDLGASAYDVFCTANLSTYPAWERAVSLLLDAGMDEVERHDQALVQRLIDGMPTGWRLRSPVDQTSRSTLVFIDAKDTNAIDRALRALDSAGVDVGERAGMIRISPHVHNTGRDIDRVLDVLARVPAG